MNGATFLRLFIFIALISQPEYVIIFGTKSNPWRDIMFYSEPTTLIVVYKDELLVNQIKKLVETKDDTDSDTAVGTKDGSVSIVSWTEKVWLDQKKAGNINNKVLFLGDIKGTDKLTPVLDVKFDEFGVKYGWAGTQAVLFVDPQAIAKKEDYDAFLQKLNSKTAKTKTEYCWKQKMIYIWIQLQQCILIISSQMKEI